MRRVAVLSLLVVGALQGTAGSAPAQAPEPAPPLRAALERCTTGVEPAGRVAEFMGSMPARRGARRMSMRFDLERRPGTRGRWRRVRGVPGFGSGERSEPDRAGFVFHKSVDGLRVPGQYRAVVRFRWHDGDGDVVRRARRRTAVCRQPDLRPDLVPDALGGSVGVVPGTARYALTLRNAGRSDAGPFAVVVAGVIAEIPGLRAGESRTFEVVAPPCAPGTLVPVVVDVDQRIDEASERGGSVLRPCPSGAV